jgi:hypothetical protein
VHQAGAPNIALLGAFHKIRSGYVIVAWIWAAIWYLFLDPLKWLLCWALNEDGFRDQVSEKSDMK